MTTLTIIITSLAGHTTIVGPEGDHFQVGQGIAFLADSG